MTAKSGRGVRGFGRVVAAGCALFCAGAVLGLSPAADAAPAPGVTSQAIQVGLPYLDFSALSAVGLSIDQGSYPEAFEALIAHLNASGGIDGRKLVLSKAEVDPLLTTSSDAACTQLTQDDKVFVAFGPVYPLCYQQAGVSTINGTLDATLSSRAAPNFTLTPPASAFDPVQLAAFAKQKVFSGKRVGVLSASADKSEVPVVLASLKKLGVNVVQAAVDSAPTNDTAASTQQIRIISQRFQNEGAQVVVGVGTGATEWLLGMNAIQSSYAPRLVATNYADFAGTVMAKGGANPTYLKGSLTATPFPSQQVFWNSPAIRQCVQIIKKAFPAGVIGNPVGASPTAPTTWVAAENSCQDLALFTAIARGAGRNLTLASFSRSAYRLRNLSVPGMGATVSFGPGRPFALGPIYVVTYDPTSKALVVAARPANQ